MDLAALLQILLALIITIALGLAGWSLSMVVTLGKQTAALKASQDSHVAEDDRMFRAEREQTDREMTSVRNEMTLQYGQVKADLARIDGSVTAIHRRLDNAPTRRLDDGP